MAGGGLGSSSRAIKRSDSLRAQHRHGQPSATILASPARQRGGWWHYSPACVRGTCGKAKKSKRFIFESYENALGRFPCRGPLCPLSEGPCGARSCPPSALDLPGDSAKHTIILTLRPINRTRSFSNVRLLVVGCSLCRVAATPMRIHNLHAGRPQETGTVHCPQSQRHPPPSGNPCSCGPPSTGGCLQTARQEGLPICSFCWQGVAEWVGAEKAAFIESAKPRWQPTPSIGARSMRRR